METKRVFITVKAPPHPSKQHQETNCCAGIDMDTSQWMRLFPIPFRLLDDDKKFPKYSVIEVTCKRPPRDRRVESYEIDQDSITILKEIGTQNNWIQRKDIVLPTISQSFCEILQQPKNTKTLGAFKPIDIEFEHTRSKPRDHQLWQAPYKQGRLFDKQLEPAEQIGHSFYYHFKCDGNPDCGGHKLMIHDWELTQAYRKWRDQYGDNVLAKIRQKWLDQICSPTKDIYFFVGNVWRHPELFMILGVFYPPKSPPTLFDGQLSR